MIRWLTNRPAGNAIVKVKSLKSKFKNDLRGGDGGAFCNKQAMQDIVLAMRTNRLWGALGFARGVKYRFSIISWLWDWRTFGTLDFRTSLAKPRGFDMAKTL
jgi:hypothetical protein